MYRRGFPERTEGGQEGRNQNPRMQGGKSMWSRIKARE